MLHFLHTFSQGYWVPQHTTGYRLLQEMFKNLSIRNGGNIIINQPGDIKILHLPHSLSTLAL